MRWGDTTTQFLCGLFYESSLERLHLPTHIGAGFLWSIKVFALAGKEGKIQIMPACFFTLFARDESEDESLCQKETSVNVYVLHALCFSVYKCFITHI